jgi:hypothetical protein
VLDGGEIGRGMFGPNPALVIAEDHVHDLRACLSAIVLLNPHLILGN